MWSREHTVYIISLWFFFAGRYNKHSFVISDAVWEYSQADLYRVFTYYKSRTIFLKLNLKAQINSN